MPKIVLKIDDSEIHGLKAIQTYINLSPDFAGHIHVDGIDYGPVTIGNIGMRIDNGLRGIHLQLCSDCGGHVMHKSGFVWSGRKRVQRWRCNNCGRTTIV